MIGTTLLIQTIKRLLRNHQLTYRDVARSLALSEPSVKRLFSNERLTVERLEQICDLLGITMVELMQEAEASRPRLQLLTREQEARIMSDPKLRLVLTCALSHWTLSDILAAYDLSEAECVKCLLVLDGMGIVQMQAGNRIRLMVTRDFDWLPDGPMRKEFFEAGLPDFLASDFHGEHETLQFAYGMLTEEAAQLLDTEVERLRARLAALHEASSGAPRRAKRGTALLLARRSWEPNTFAQFRRRSTSS